MKLRKSLVFLILTLIFSTASTTGLADGPELKFTSLVTAVTQTDLETGIVEISIQALDLPILVNGGTEIEYQSEHIDIAEISAGDLVKIRAFFLDEGITAEEIEVLETRFQRFHLNGVITSLDMLGEDTFIAVAGVEVRANGSTLVVPRNDSDAQAVESLQVGDEISVIGRLEDSALQALKIHAGTRTHGEIEFDGTLLAVDSSSIAVEIETGVEVTAVLTEDSRIRGTLMPGAFVEVDGLFNSSLDLIVKKVAVDSDGDRDADDDDPRSGERGGDENGETEVGSEITLLAENSLLSGKAEFRLRSRDGEIDQKFEVEIEDSEPSIAYTIIVNFGNQAVNLGTVTANSFGEASAEFEVDDNVSDRDLTPFLPDGMFVTDIDSVEILRDGEPVLSGQFNSPEFDSALLSQSHPASSQEDDDSGAGDSSDDDSDVDDSSDDNSDENSSNDSNSDEDRSNDDDSANDNSNSDSIDDGSLDDNSNAGTSGNSSNSDASSEDGQEIESEVLLASVVGSVHGEADIRYRDRNGVVDQKFQVEIEDTTAATTFSILVFFGNQSVDFGTLETNAFGEAEAEFEIDDTISDRPLAPFLPEGKSVLDITSVQVLRGGEVVAEGSF